MSKLPPAKLYYVQGSPFARLCRILIKDWQLPVHCIEVPHPLPDEHFERNPFGTVPVLETVGETIFPTSQIVEQLWAMTLEGQEPNLDPLADRQLLTVILELGDIIVAANQIIWAGFEQTGQNTLGYDVHERHQMRIQKVLAWIEDQSDGWLMGDEMSVCDFAIACIMQYGDARIPFEWRHNKKIAAIVDALADRQSFLDTAPKPLP